eukprot:222544_1
MKNTPQWLNKLRRSLNELSKNANTKQLQNQLDSTSKQMKQTLNLTSKKIQKSMNNHYENLPQYKSQMHTQLLKAAHKSKQLNTQFQQKFHEFSQSNPTVKRYHSKYQTQIHNISKNIPNFNVKKSIDSTKKSIDSTINQSKKIASNVQSTAKQVTDTPKKVISTVSSSVSSAGQTMSNIPSKMVSVATKPIYSTYKATQNIINPNKWTNKLFNYFNRIKTWILIYGCVGIASLMIVNQFSYMGLLYMIRHRYDENKKITLFGMDMVWIYKWLNIPYNGDINSQRNKLLNDSEKDNDCKDNEQNKKEYVLDERQIQDYNINADVKLAKMAYYGLLYPRIGAAMLLTFTIGTPLLRVVLWFKPKP